MKVKEPDVPPKTPAGNWRVKSKTELEVVRKENPANFRRYIKGYMKDGDEEVKAYSRDEWNEILAIEKTNPLVVSKGEPKKAKRKGLMC